MRAVCSPRCCSSVFKKALGSWKLQTPRPTNSLIRCLVPTCRGLGSSEDFSFFDLPLKFHPAAIRAPAALNTPNGAMGVTGGNAKLSSYVALEPAAAMDPAKLAWV